MKSQTHDDHQVLKLEGYVDQAPERWIISRYIPPLPGRAQSDLRYWFFYRISFLDRATYIREGLAKLLQLAKAMLYLHDHNVIHGDLKASNAMVDVTGDLLLADFGMARVRLDVTDAGSSGQTLRNGTPIFNPPEYVYRPGRTTDKGDVYMFAMVMYEFFSGGKEPFPGVARGPGLDAQIRMGTRTDKLPWVTKDVDEIWELMERCWDKEPRSRPGFAQVVLDLEELLRKAGGP